MRVKEELWFLEVVGEERYEIRDLNGYMNKEKLFWWKRGLQPQ